jgi:histidinol-phosphate aminotransferase
MRPRRELAALAPAFHGGAPPTVEPVLDFSVCSNPLGPSPRVVAAARAAAVERYPERESAALRGALAEKLDLAATQVVIGNGSVELFWLLALCYVERGDRVLLVAPTFAEYARPARLMGAEIVTHHLAAERGFAADVPALVAMMQSNQPRLIFVCNPNNPTGSYLSRNAVETLLAAAPGLLVLDEAYVGLTAGAWDTRPLLDDQRLVLVRSLTKDHALPGLRLGYALAAPDVARALQWAQPPWSVNALAQAAGLAALADDEHVARGRALAAEAVAYLAEGLHDLGCAVVSSAANFLLADVADAAHITTALLQAGVYVRDCTSFGLPRHIRIAARPGNECEALLRAMRAVMQAPAPVSDAALSSVTA